MSRRHAAVKREVTPDAKYHNTVVTKFMNSLMYDGQKSKAEEILYGAINELENKLHKSGLEIFTEALNNVKPLLEVRSRRVGGATYQVPCERTSKTGLTFSIASWKTVNASCLDF